MGDPGGSQGRFSQVPDERLIEMYQLAALLAAIGLKLNDKEVEELIELRLELKIRRIIK